MLKTATSQLRPWSSTAMVLWNGPHAISCRAINSKAFSLLQSLSVREETLLGRLQRQNSVVARSFHAPTSASCASNTPDAKESEEGKVPEAKSEGAANPELERLTVENTELKGKYDDLMDKYRRSIAESDNMRKRLTKQIDDAKIFGIQSFCKDLIDVADVLGKATEDATTASSSTSDANKLVKDMLEGLRLTHAELLNVFRRHGLEQENPVGQKFDPNRHEALFQVPVEDKEPNTVIDVQKIGYMLQGRTIRPAKVGVSKKK